MGKEKTTPEVSVTGAIAFTKQEIGIMRICLMFTAATPGPTGQLPVRYLKKEEELVGLNTFKEFKKSYKIVKVKNAAGVEVEQENIEDAELTFGTEQKKLLMDCINSFPMGVSELELKFAILEKLK